MHYTERLPATVTTTNLSTIDGLTHVHISVGNLGGLTAASALHGYLSGQSTLSSVGGIYDAGTDECQLYTFVQADSKLAAIEHLKQLLSMTTH